MDKTNRKRSPEENLNLPTWYRCTWVRKPCGKKSCQVCHRIDSNDCELESGNPTVDLIVKHLNEAFALLQIQAKKLGINLNDANVKFKPQKSEDRFKPDPLANALVKKVNQLVNYAYEHDQPWTMTETCADLIWYSKIVANKSGRLNWTRLKLKESLNYQADFDYTFNVIRESLGFIDSSLGELTTLAPKQSVEILWLKTTLNELNKKLLINLD